MIKSWIISGVPRMIQTMNLDIMLKGRNLDMDPKGYYQAQRYRSYQRDEE